MSQTLDDEQVHEALRTLPLWSGDATGLQRSITFPDFLAGIAAVNAVAKAAEQANHHPDMDIRWRTVTFTLATHSAGGVTQQDLDLARRIDEITG